MTDTSLYWSVLDTIFSSAKAFCWHQLQQWFDKSIIVQELDSF